MKDPKRSLLLRLRRTVRVSSRFDVRQVDDRTEEQVCRTCGHRDVYVLPQQVDATLAKRLIKYRANGGVWGVCRGCSKAEADRRYPLDTCR